MDARYPLVLLHALPLDSRMWTAQVRDLARSGRVLARDLPGFGRAAPAGPSVDAWARGVAVWLRGQGVEKAVIAGCSMGGYVGLAFLREAPDMLAGIALVCSRTAADTDAQRNARSTAIAQIQNEGVAAWGRTFLDRALSPWTRERNPALVDTILEIIIAQPADSIIAAQRALAARPDSTDIFLDAPSDVSRAAIHAVDDNIIPLEEAVALAKRARVNPVIVKNAGHLAPLEQPEKVTDAIREFWCRCGSSE